MRPLKARDGLLGRPSLGRGSLGSASSRSSVVFGRLQLAAAHPKQETSKYRQEDGGYGLNGGRYGRQEGQPTFGSRSIFNKGHSRTRRGRNQHAKAGANWRRSQESCGAGSLDPAYHARCPQL